jgi:hypothetical protein
LYHRRRPIEGKVRRGVLAGEHSGLTAYEGLEKVGEIRSFHLVDPSIREGTLKAFVKYSDRPMIVGVDMLLGPVAEEGGFSFSNEAVGEEALG